jgi:hypothetical protein
MTAKKILTANPTLWYEHRIFFNGMEVMICKWTCRSPVKCAAVVGKSIIWQ